MQESDSLSAVWRSYRSWRLGGHTRCRGRAGSPELMHSIHIQHAKFSDPGEAMTGSPYRLPRYCFPTIQRRQPSQLCVRFRGSITSTSRLSAYCLAILRLTLSITRHSPRTRYRWFGSDLTGRASHPLWTAPFARRTELETSSGDRPRADESSDAPVPAGYSGSLRDVMKTVETQYICKVLNECNGRVGEAAVRLGIHRTMLYRKLCQSTRNLPVAE